MLQILFKTATYYTKSSTQPPLLNASS